MRKIAALALVLALAATVAIDARRPPARQWAVVPMLAVIDAWQAVTRYLPGGGCRFTPSCSVYGEVMVRRHGAFRGGWLAARRIWSCNPWGGEGEDWPE